MCQFVASKKDTLSFYLVRADRKASDKTTSLDKILVLSNRATWYNQSHSDQKTRTFKILYIFLFLLFFFVFHGTNWSSPDQLTKKLEKKLQSHKNRNLRKFFIFLQKKEFLRFFIISQKHTFLIFYISRSDLAHPNKTNGKTKTVIQKQKSLKTFLYV